MKKVLYPGTFDPITNGHLDVIERASRVSDVAVVGVILNPSKKPLFTVEERVEMIKKVTRKINNVEVDCFSGLLVDYVKNNNITAVVRGLRASMDFEYEIQMAQMNARLYDKMETLFLMTRSDYSFISSSMVKEVFHFGGNIEGLVPNEVLEYMKEKTKK